VNHGAIFVIARLTLREAFRRRLLWALVGLTLVLVVATGWLFGKAAELSPLEGGTQQLVLSQLLVMIAFMFSFVLTMTAAFAASPAIGPEIENGLLLAGLARPVRRADVLLGRWLGLAVVVSAMPCRGLPRDRRGLAHDELHPARPAGGADLPGR